MKTGTPFRAYHELRDLITSLERQYSAAIESDRTQDMIESCGGLCIAYSAVGNGDLARKWAEQYLNHLAQCTGGHFGAASAREQER